MRRSWWISVFAINFILIVATIVGGGLTKRGIQSIIANYIIISTAIVVVIFAVIPIQREMFLLIHKKFQEKITENPNLVDEIFNLHDLAFTTYHSIDISLGCAILTIFCCIFALYLNNLTLGTWKYAVICITYAATIFITISIAELSDLTLKIFIPKT
jgi:hypothetical protein